MSRSRKYEFIDKVLDTVEPYTDSSYGPMYRCSVTLKDGLFLPCVVLQSKARLIDFAEGRLREEQGRKGVFRKTKDPLREYLGVIVASGSRINDYDVAEASPSKFAPPLDLLRQIRGETSMGWTGWVFEMTDGNLFSYGSAFSMEFFDLPEGYSFDQVSKVHSHSFLGPDGGLESIKLNRSSARGYAQQDSVYRERIYFMCAVDNI